MIDTMKKCRQYLLAMLAGTWVGFYIGTQYYPRVETKTVAVDKQSIVKGAVTSETKRPRCLIVR